MSNTFTAYVARTDDGVFSRGIEELPVEALGTGGVLIEVRRSTVNYKDSLAASEKGRVARISPLVVGIDLAGEVLESDSDEFRPGDLVLAGGYDIGVAHHGGLAQLARVPADWVVKLPEGISTSTRPW